MPVEFDSKKKKEELQQMRTTRVQQLQCWSSNTMATTTIHGFITPRTRKCHVSHLSMNSGSLKILIEILIQAFHSFLGDSTSQTGQQALSMTLQDERTKKERRKRKEKPHHWRSRSCSNDWNVSRWWCWWRCVCDGDVDGYMVFVSSRQNSFLFFYLCFFSLFPLSPSSTDGVRTG